MKNGEILAVIILGAVGIYLLYKKDSGCSCNKNFSGSIAEIQEEENEESTIVNVEELMPNFGKPIIKINQPSKSQFL